MFHIIARNLWTYVCNYSMLCSIVSFKLIYELKIQVIFFSSSDSIDIIKHYIVFLSKRSNSCCDRVCFIVLILARWGVFNLISWLLVSWEIGDSWSLIAGFCWRENHGPAPEIHSWGPLNRAVFLMKHLDWDYKLNISMPRCGSGDNKYVSKQQFSCLSS